MEYEIAALLADVVIQRADELNNVPAGKWAAQYMRYKRGDWVDQLIAEKALHLRQQIK